MADSISTIQTKTPQQSSAPQGDIMTLQLTIRNTQKLLFDDTVKGITSLNKKGVFDILPLHENFISLIQEYITIYKLNGEKQTFPLKNGIVHVTGNTIRCYIDLLAAPEIPTPSNQPTPSQKTT